MARRYAARVNGRDFGGSRVRLPAGAERPLQVYVNGVPQNEGVDFAIDGPEIVFRERLVQPRPTRLRDLARLLVAGRYKPEHTVDVVFHSGGVAQIAHRLDILPPAGG